MATLLADGELLRLFKKTPKMNKILFLWQTIGAFGINKQHTPKQAEEIELINHVALLTFCITFPSVFIIYLYFGNSYQSLLNLILAVHYLLVFLFNRAGIHLFAKIFLFFITILHVFLSASTFGYAGNLHFIYIPVIFATILTFDKTEAKSVIFLFSMILLAFLVLILTDFSLFLSPQVTFAQQRAISWISIYLGIVGSIVVSYFYIDRFTKQTHLVKKANELLQTKFDELQKLNTELDRFVYSISHDLKAPISSVLGLVYLGKRASDLAEAHQYFDLQDKSLRKLNGFIADIMDYSRNNRTELQLQAIDFEGEIANMLEMQADHRPEHQVKSSFVVSQATPFINDRHRLLVVLNNLVSNAFRYYNPYQPHSWVKVVVEVAPKESTIVISDNGIGIGREHLPRIFDMFYRATDRATGSGLGLYIVKEVINKLGGTIQVESVEGHGTTFTITIPNLTD